MVGKRKEHKRTLRVGYTTGACSAAAAKAATLILGIRGLGLVKDVEIPFPDGSRVKFNVYSSGLYNEKAWASVIKDAGDDPDITNGAEIKAEISIEHTGESSQQRIIIKGGEGIGVVTKPGLPVKVGEPAINPVPKRMIEEAVFEAIEELSVINERLGIGKNLEVAVSVPDGERLSKKTMNPRLGIIGGISILGTTGFVRPISSEAWTATITASMDVAKAMGLKDVVLSAGRASEKAHMKKYSLPEESYVMMGDYLEFSLLEAKKHGFERIHLSAQWAKMLKIAMVTPQTHVRYGAIDIKKATQFLAALKGLNDLKDTNFNTAREIFDFISSSLPYHFPSLLKRVCIEAKCYAESITQGISVTTHLVSYDGGIIANSE